ncbi:MAG: hypothetical protein AAF085_12655, partial [Planctomycetota bacterium]
MTQNTTMPVESAQKSLILGVEVWSPVESTMVRQAAAPSIGELDQLVGPSHSRVIAGRVDEARLSRMPSLVKLEQLNAVALIWPIIDREQVTSVLAFYIRQDPSASLAAELWTGRPGRSELCLGQSSYCSVDRFAKLSPHIAFPKGSGMPGRVWQTNLPQMDGDLTNSATFMRSTGASNVGLDVGYAMPCVDGTSLQAVALLLSGKECPIVRAYETWVPTQRAGSLRLGCLEGVYLDTPTVEKASRNLDVPAGDTWVGRAW